MFGSGPGNLSPPSAPPRHQRETRRSLTRLWKPICSPMPRSPKPPVPKLGSLGMLFEADRNLACLLVLNPLVLEGGRHGWEDRW